MGAGPGDEILEMQVKEVLRPFVAGDIEGAAREVRRLLARLMGARSRHRCCGWPADGVHQDTCGRNAALELDRAEYLRIHAGMGYEKYGPACRTECALGPEIDHPGYLGYRCIDSNGDPLPFLESGDA